MTRIAGPSSSFLCHFSFSADGRSPPGMGGGGGRGTDAEAQRLAAEFPGLEFPVVWAVLAEAGGRAAEALPVALACKPLRGTTLGN